MNSEVKEICPLSHLNQPHVLLQRPGGNTESGCFSCGQRRSFVTSRGVHYYCTTCDVEFHRVCHKFPRKIRHPYHPQHPLTFTFRDNETGIISDTNTGESLWLALFSGSIIITDPNKLGSVQDIWSQSDKCSWCTKDIECNWFYRCSLCSFSLDLSCYKNIPLFQTVEKPKNHHHSLVFYARPLLTPCDACGLVNVLDPSYTCFQCNFMVHQSCMSLPRVIKITRHQHRLSHTLYIEAVTSPCRICYKPVDIKCGQYSCNQEDCSYVVHSKCATHEMVWDGKELEWEPEKSDESEDDTIPFTKMERSNVKRALFL
ncbi:uncharacterized protein LOC108861525 isoform X2 [Raphanus sativus]|uniref:Uncharacterized protein LOC108861525 isoform X2 n=1 Tax=Raphanus sativus TaxID=3726 RepID=A0A6J0P271_RAPSA|nr:uncharacterized protein LOC108861525 isoform X2 [Raphanus sativus]